MSTYDKIKEAPPWKPLEGGSNHKMYILVRGDLSKSQQAVQACHAIAQCVLENKHEEPDRYRWRNGTIVILKVGDLIDLVVWRENLTAQGYKVAEFKEPDIGNQTTAIALTGDDLEDKFMRLPLL